MICGIIRKIVLYIYWNCLSEEDRQIKSKEHYYSTIKAEHVEEVVVKNNEIKVEISCIQYRLEKLKNKILVSEKNSDLINDIINEIDFMINECHNV